MKIINAKPLNREQAKHLRARISEIRGRRWTIAEATCATAVPAAVAKARKLVDAWEKKQNAARRRVQRRVEKRTDAVTALLLFGDPTQALRAVEALEREFP